MNKFKKMIKNNKKLQYVIVALLLVVAVLIGILFFQTSNSPDAVRKTTKTSADSLKSQAIKILETNPKKAKELLQQSLEKYQTIDDRNNIVDVNAQLYMIDHAN